jgi:hypothetical protein
MHNCEDIQLLNIFELKWFSLHILLNDMAAFVFSDFFFRILVFIGRFCLLGINKLYVFHIVH